MKRLLRGIINFEDGKISEDGLRANFQRIRHNQIEWVQPIDAKLFKSVKDFFDTNLEPPTAQTLLDQYRGSGDIEAEERLKDVAAAPVYVRKNFENLLRDLADAQNRDKMRGLLKETEEIVYRGLTVTDPKTREKVSIKGVKEALMHFTRKVHELIPQDYNAQTRGDLRESAETTSAWEDYQTAKANKNKAYGAFTGLNEIDKICKGCKRGELWIHAGFIGELKTSFALNWCYNLVTRYRKNVFYVSMEMPFNQIRRIIYVIHSANKKWQELGYVPLDYRKVRDGEMTEDEEAFFQIVLKDFEDNPEHCRFEVWAPDRDVTVDDIRLEVELKHKDMEIALTVLDHGGLVAPKAKHRDYTIELNSVVRDAKKFALHFNNGEGMATLLLFQLNRQGKDDADKNEGRYKIKALTYANEAEKSADYITTTYLNEEHRKNATTVFCNLKNRDNPLFEPFTASVNFACRRIFNFDPTFSTTPGMSSSETDDILARMALL